MPRVAEPDVLPRFLSGRYRLEATLGQGGMGVVYRGTDLAMSRPVAVKLLRSMDGTPIDDVVAGRFLREARNTARIQHEHIVEVFDLGQAEDGGLYFVMELLEGESLAQLLRRERRLSPERTVHIAQQMCEALEVAHTAGVIHRDLKPANIMLLRRAGDDAFVKVLDFGVAKSFGPERGDETQLTRTGMLVGTIDYMAPEQITGRPVDGRTDVYALGVMLYRMLAGKPPFPEGSVPQLIHAHVNTLPKPLNEVAAEVPSELALIVLRCLAKKPERRFESMAELGRALVQAIAPPSVPERAAPDSDLYGDETAVGRALPAPVPPAPRVLPVLNDETLSGPMDDPIEDATLLLDRNLGYPLPPPSPRMISGAPGTGRMPAMRAPQQPAYGAPPAHVPPHAPLVPPGHAVPPGAHVPAPSGYDPSGMQLAPWAPPAPPRPPSLWHRFLVWTGLRSR